MTPNGIHWVDMKNAAVVPSYGFGCDNPSVDTLALPLRGWGFFYFQIRLVTCVKYLHVMKNVLSCTYQPYGWTNVQFIIEK